MRTVVHVGYVKSASSSLQNLWFDTSTAYFAGKRPRRSGSRFVTEELDMALRSRIGLPESADFDIDKARAAADEVKEMASAEGKDTVLISVESLTGVSFSGYGASRAPFEIVAQRLSEMWREDIHFVIIVREQVSFLTSYHAQLVKQGYSTSLRTFVDKSLGNIENIPITDGPLPGLRYDLQIEAAKRTGHSVTWAPFEALVGDEFALNWLASEIGLTFDAGAGLPHINKTRSATKLEDKLARISEQGTSKFDWREQAAAINAEKLARTSKDYARVGNGMSTSQEKAVRAYFAPHNAKLSHPAFNLCDLGYAMP